MTISVVQSANAESTSNVNSLAVSFASTPAPGNTVVALCSYFGSANANYDITSVVDNQGNTYTKSVDSSFDANGLGVCIWTATNVVASGTFTVTAAAVAGYSPFITIAVVEVASVNKVDLAVSGFANTNTNPTLGPTANTAVANEIVLAITALNASSNPTSVSSPTGYTNVTAYQNGTASVPFSVDYRITSSVESENPTWTSTAGSYSDWAAALVSLYEVSSSLTNIDATPQATSEISATTNSTGQFAATPKGDSTASGVLSVPYTTSTSPTGRSEILASLGASFAVAPVGQSETSIYFSLQNIAASPAGESASTVSLGSTTNINPATYGDLTAAVVANNTAPALTEVSATPSGTSSIYTALSIPFQVTVSGQSESQIQTSIQFFVNAVAQSELSLSLPSYNYYWPVIANNRARSVNAVPYGASVSVLDWYYPTVYSLQSGTLAAQSLNLPEGFWTACAGVSSDVWAVGYSQYLTHLVSGSVGVNYALPNNPGITGCALVSGAPYMVTMGGLVYTLNSGVITEVTGNFSQSARFLRSYGSALYTLLPGVPAVGVLTLATAISGSVSQISVPQDTPYNIAISPTGNLGVVGTNYSTLASGFSNFATHPSDSEIMVGVYGTNNTVQLLEATNRVWGSVQTVSGAGGPTYVAWTPNGEQVLVSNPHNNTVQVFGYTSNTLTLSGSITVSGASALAVTPDNSTALVCYPADDSIYVLTNSLGAWSSSGTVTIPNPTSVVATSATTAIVGYNAGVAWLTKISGTWTVTNTIARNSIVSNICVDPNGNVYAASTYAGLVYISILVNQQYSAVVTYPGTISGLFYEQGQLVALDAMNNLYRSFGNINGVCSLLGQGPIPTGATAVGVGNETVFITNSSVTWQMQFGAPYQLDRTEIGRISLYSGGSWVTTALAIEERPNTVVFDTSNGMWVTTQKNILHQLSSAGTLVASTQIPTYAGQEVGVPLGISDLLWYKGHLYGSSSLNGALLELQ